VARPLRILIATKNPGKLREIRRLTAGHDWSFLSLADLPAIPEAVEDGATFAENARKKALHYAGHSGLPTLADDSGLEVDALDGAPGVHSARYAGEPRDDAANNRKLLEHLAGVLPQQRTARFRCAMALAIPGRVLAETQGCVEGLILTEPRGTGGFGYDPLFLLPELGRTMAELEPDEKNRLSHRGQALREMLARLEQLEPLLRQPRP